MQFDCTTCFISYFMGFLRFIGKHKVGLFLVGVLKTVLTWSVKLDAELGQGDYVPWSLVIGGVSAIIFLWSCRLTVYINIAFLNFLTLH